MHHVLLHFQQIASKIIYSYRYESNGDSTVVSLVACNLKFLCVSWRVIKYMRVSCESKHFVFDFIFYDLFPKTKNENQPRNVSPFTFINRQRLFCSTVTTKRLYRFVWIIRRDQLQFWSMKVERWINRFGRISYPSIWYRKRFVSYKRNWIYSSKYVLLKFHRLSNTKFI